MKLINTDHTLPEGHPDQELIKDIFSIQRLKSSHSKLPISDSVMESKLAHYIQTYSLRYWDSEEAYELKRKIAKRIEEFNSKSTDYEMYLGDSFSDYELEADGDRSWPASYHVGFIKKDTKLAKD